MFYKSQFLLADPFLLGPVFERSVVFLADHSEEGAMGFIMNNPTGFLVDEIIPDLEDCKLPVYYGGPVDESTLFYLRTLGNEIENCIPVSENLWWGGEFEDLKKLSLAGKVNSSNIKFFIGYSGWEPEQLEKEIQKSSWIVKPIKTAFLFDDHTKNLWNEELKRSKSNNSFLGQFAHNPSMN